MEEQNPQPINGDQTLDKIDQKEQSVISSSSKKPKNKKKKILIIVLLGLFLLIVTALLLITLKEYWQPLLKRIPSKTVQQKDSAFGDLTSNKSSQQEDEAVENDRQVKLTPEIQQLVDTYEKIPERADYKTTIRGIKIYDTPEKRLTDAEIMLIEEALSMVPQRIVDIRPNGIIASTRKESGSIHIESVVLIAAYARGMNFYILDETFEGVAVIGDKVIQTAEDISETMIHEFVHIEQYKTIPKENLTNFNFYNYSSWANDYARSVGWIKEGSFWKLPDKTVTVSRYADSSIFEDQAVSIAMFATGHPEVINKDRVDWISDWFGKGPENFYAGVFPRLGVALGMSSEPQGLKLEEEDFLNTKYVSRYKQDFNSIKMYGWQTVSMSDEADIGTRSVKEYYSNILDERGWSGSFSVLQQGYGGEFTYKDKRVYVEIVPKTYDEENTYILVLEGIVED